MKKLLLFDIDGTLLLSGGVGKLAFNEAMFKVFGVPDSWGQTLPFGKTDPEILDEVVLRVCGRLPDEDEVSRVWDIYVQKFADEIQSALKFRVLKGVTSLLDYLSDRSDVLLGLGTGNLERTAYLKLDRGGISKYFNFGGFASDSRNRRELIGIAIERGKALLGVEPSEIVVIGDAPQDIDAAKFSGAKVIAVATGNCSLSELKELGPDHALRDLGNLEEFLSCLDDS